MSDKATDPRDGIRERFSRIDTATIADVLDRHGLHDQGVSPALRPVSGERLCGWAYTIAGQMTPYDMAGGDPDKVAACSGVGPGEVVTWSGDGEGICYFGDLIALGMRERGAVGALVDGGVRDTRVMAEIGFPVFARYRTPIQSIGRWKVTSSQLPVSVAGATRRHVRVEPGDLIAGDADGVVVVPGRLAVEVLEAAEAVTRTDEQVREAIRGGLSLAEAREKFGHL